MTAPTLWVPFSVLNEPGHSPKTRLIGLLLGSQAARDRSTLTDARLRMLSGLDLKTIARARARLAQAPLGPCYVKPHPSCAAIPEALLTAADISAGARLLYGQLQGVPNFADQGGSFTYAALSQLTGSSDEALRRAAAELASAGWLAMTQANRKSPVNFTLRNPVTALVWARLSSIRQSEKCPVPGRGSPARVPERNGSPGQVRRQRGTGSSAQSVHRGIDGA